jgi:hypothetical protein
MTLTITPLSLAVMLVTMLLGIVHQAINTGKIVKWQVPASWTAWLVIIGPFLAGVSASLASATAFSVDVAVNALINGLETVCSGAVPGVTVHLAVHAHYNVPKMITDMRNKARSLRANDNASAEAGNKAA